MVNVVPREVPRPWDLPRHNIHHDTSSAFSNNVSMYDVVFNSIMAINKISLAKSEPDLLETTAHLNRIENEAFRLQEEGD